MRVAQVSHYALPHLGGIEIYAQKVGRDLRAAGDESRLFSSRRSLRSEALGSGTGSQRAVGGEAVAPRGRDAGAVGGEAGALPEREGVTYLPSLGARNPLLFGLGRALRAFRPEVVLAHSIWFWPSLQAARTGLPLAVVVHGVWPDEAGPALRALLRGYRPLAQRVLDAARAIIVLSEDEREKLHRRFRVSPQRVRVIGNGPDLIEPEPPERTRYILFTGRVIPEKNAHVLAGACADLPVDLVFLGPCPAEYAARLGGPRVTLVPPLDPLRDARALAGWYAGADLSVAIGDWEGQPTRVLESLAQGTPALTTSTLVRDGENGLRVARPEVAQVRAAILRWLALPEAERVAMRARARRSVEEQLWPARFAALRDVLAECAR